MNFTERLNWAFTEANITRTALWKHCGVSSGLATQWLDGTIKKVSGDNLLKIAKILNVDPEWLQNGKGRPKKSANDESGDFTIDQYHDVSASMGDGLVLRDQPGQITGWRVTPEWLENNVPSNTGRNNLCIVTGFGDSMRGMFNSGDPLIVDAGVKELKYDGVYFFRVGEEGFIKRLQRIPGEGIRVISKNPDYESWTIKPDMDFELFGRVLKVWKSEEF